MLLIWSVVACEDGLYLEDAGRAVDIACEFESVNAHTPIEVGCPAAATHL